MGLIVRSPSWSKCTTNYSGTPGASLTVPGTTVLEGASNALGTAVSVITALAHDCEYLVLGMGGHSFAAADGSMLMDILIDPAGGSSWSSSPLISSLVCGDPPDQGSAVNPSIWYHFPLFIKSGASIGAQLRTTSANFSIILHCYAYGGNASPSTWWCGSHVESIGINTATSSGTSHTPGSSGTFSSWTNIGSTQVGPSGAVQFGVQFDLGATTPTAMNYFFQFGVGSTQVGPTIWKGNPITDRTNIFTPSAPIFCSTPNGTQWMARAVASGTAQAHDVAIYVVH